VRRSQESIEGVGNY